MVVVWMGLHAETLAAVRKKCPVAFDDSPNLSAVNVVVVDATERLMYATSNDSPSPPQTMLDVYYAVESFVRTKVCSCAKGSFRVAVVLIDDGLGVPCEKGVAHVQRYSKSVSVPAASIGRCSGSQADITGIEHPLPWDQISEEAKTKSANAGWREIVSNRDIRQRMAAFVTRKLIESATLGLGVGSALIVSGVRATDAGPSQGNTVPLTVVQMARREGVTVRIVEEITDVIPSQGAGEADIKTPLIIRWLTGPRIWEWLAPPNVEPLIVVTSRDSDMVPICSCERLVAAVDQPKAARARVLWLRLRYERSERKYHTTAVDLTAIAREFVLEAVARNMSPVSSFLSYMFCVAICGCDFVRRIKAVKLPELARTALKIMPVGTMSTVGVASTGCEAMRLVEVNVEKARACILHAWQATFDARLSSLDKRQFRNSQSLSQIYNTIRESKDGTRFKITPAEIDTVEANCRAALWVAHYWGAAAMGARAVSIFSTDACYCRGVAHVVTPFGFEITKGSNKRTTVNHASDPEIRQLSLPIIMYPAMTGPWSRVTSLRENMQFPPATKRGRARDDACDSGCKRRVEQSPKLPA